MATHFYFPNYPYNDLTEDPFLLADSNAYNMECKTYTIAATADAEYTYTNCLTNTEEGAQILAGETIEVCSLSVPVVTPSTAATPAAVLFDVYQLSVKRPTFGTKYAHFAYKDIENNDRTVFISVS